MKTSLFKETPKYFISLFGRIILLVILPLAFAGMAHAQSRSQNSLDSLHLLLESTSSTDTNYVYHLIAIGKLYHNSKLDSALVFYNEAIQKSKELDFVKGQAISNSYLGKFYLDKGQFVNAKENLEAADSLSKKQNYEKLWLGNAIQLGVAYIMLGEFDKASSLTKNGKEIAEKFKDWKSLGYFFKNSGSVYSRQSDFQKSLEANLKAITYFEKANFMSGVAGMHNNIGHIYSEIGQPQKSIEQFEKAMIIFQNIGDKAGEILCLDNIGNRYIKLQKLDLALPYLYDANKLIRQSNENLKLLYNCINLADALAKNGELRESEKFIKEATILCEQMEIKNLLPYVYAILALVREKQGRIEEAKSLHLKVIRIAETNMPPNQLIQIKKNAAEFFEKHKYFQQALLYTNEAQLIQDSVFNLKKTKEIAALQTQFETQEKEKENALLRKDNELQALKIQQQQKNLFIGILSSLIFLGLATFLFFQRKKLRATKSQLEISLQEKETLLKEIHHRVKNNLQLVTSLLNIQAEKESPQTIDEFLTQGQNRVKSMALIHEQLYRSDNISSIDIKEYAENLVKSIFDIHGNQSIIYKIQSDHTHLDIDQAIPLGLIINELVNNSLKHAFTIKDGGNLQVQMKQSDHQLEVIVKDDGDGFSPDNSKNSIGLQLVHILAKQLKGTFELYHQAGTSARLVFPTT